MERLGERFTGCVQRSTSLMWALGLGCLLWLCAGLCAAADTASGDHVQVRWLLPEQFASGEQSTTIGLLFEVDEHWHIYWRNAGDSGAAPKFQFTPATGVEISEPQWPTPTRLPIEHLTNLGYSGDVAYLFELTTAEGLEEVSASVELEWLVCKVDCIPGFATMDFSRPVQWEQASWNSETLATLQHFAAQVPKSANEFPAQITQSDWQQDKQSLLIELTGLDPNADFNIWPLQGDFIAAKAPLIEAMEDGFRVRFQTLPVAQKPDSVEFVVKSGTTAWQSPAVAVATAQVEAGMLPESLPLPVPMLLFLALMGGVILNAMPCVFPVLSIKVFQLMRAAENESTQLRHEAFVYSFGVVTTFVVLGAAFLTLRAVGYAVGWGFQLQSPPVVLALIVLFWCLALSFIGVVEWGNSLMRLAGRPDTRSSFLTGMLAVFVATPCTGPFMGVALGAATVVTPLQALLIFIAMGVGLALPMVLLALAPGLLARLPAPGKWMTRAREFLAFPLFATVIWLAWVMAQTVGEQAWLWVSALLLVVALAFWLAQFNRWWKIAAAVMVLTTAVWSVPQLLRERPQEQVARDGRWTTYDAEEIAAARIRKQAVLVDFTAAWCITCQVNKSLVLTTDAAYQLFEQHDVLLMRADWTRYDEAITAALAEFERNSVPLYVYYPADGGAPEILPQVLSLNILKDTLRAGG